jgi:CubicO group peptidase (beta-lactamase class C family)
MDDRVGLYLPIFDTYGKGHITIRQCFSMKSGLSLKEPEYERDPTLTLPESVDLIAANAPIVFPPGTMLDYEGDGMQTVGRICEVVTGKDWRTLAREVLFDPLDIPDADYDAFGLNPAVAGGARCTATEYLKFLRMILRNGLADNGNVILSSRSVQEFFTNQTYGLPEYYSPAQESEFYAYDERPDYGMGSWVMAQNPASGVVEEVASPGAFGTFPWVDRKRRLRGIVFMLGSGTTAWQSSLELQSILRAEIDLKGLPPAEPPGQLTASRVSGCLQLTWSGGGVLETSTDFQTWLPLPWASTPFLESLDHPPGPKMFYRVRRD